MDHSFPPPPPPRGSWSNGLMGFGEGGGNGGLSSLMIMSSTFMPAAPLNLPLPPKHNQNNGSNNSNLFFLSDLNSFNSNFNPCGNNNNQITSIDIQQVPFNEGDSIKSKIMSHPLYPRLLSSYISCHKVGAPPEVVAKLEEACNIGGRGGIGRVSGYIGEDPALDQFMEAYCEMLTKYEQEISKPFKEAMAFFSRAESQFKSLTLANLTSSIPDPGVVNNIDKNTNASSDDDDIDIDENFIDPQAEDQELKGQLLRKYSGYLGSLKKEFLKKRKKGKLPKEARQQLLDWWTRHLKWPYPSESQKIALAESTGLDPKQINNWFINQRKRHWKPAEEMQFVVMDGTAASGVSSLPSHYYMDNGYGGGVNPFTLDCGAPLF